MAANEEAIDTANLNQLIQNLMAIMSPIPEQRKASEEALKLLEVTDDFGVHLAKITLDNNYDLSLRQLSSVILKQYVQTHWYTMSDKFNPPEVNDIAKSAIRKMLPYGLRDQHSKVRSCIAYAISAIAHWDWPENWPDLFKCLMEILAEGEPNSTHGAMRVLTEFIREVTDAHISSIAPVFLPEMYRIFTSVQLYNIRTRSRAVEIFNTSANMLHASGDKNIQNSVVNVLPQFVETFLQAMKVEDGEYSDCGLKKEVLKSLNDLIRNFPKYMKSAMSEILPMVWGTLTESANKYIISDVNSSEDVDKIVDSDGEIIGFNNLVFSIFEFIETFLDMKNYRQVVRKSLNDLFHYFVIYMQITNEQLISWSENPDQFVEDEDDETFSYSVRISAQDLFMACCKEFKVESMYAIRAIVERHTTEANKMRESNNENWWKIYEALFYAVGSVQPLTMECVNADNNIFDVTKFITDIVIPCLKLNDVPFLLGRALWFASRFATAVPDAMLSELLQLTVTALQPNQNAAVRISAVRAIYNYCDHLKQQNKTGFLLPYLPSLIEGLIQLISTATIEILALSLETLSVAVQVDSVITQSYEPKITPLAIAVFLRYNVDPLIMSLITEIFEALAANDKCNQALLDRLLPTIASILTAQPDKVSSNLVVMALEIMPGIIRNTKPPLPDILISKVFPAIVNCIVQSDDNTVVSNGGECIRAFISVSSSQVQQLKTPDGVDGLHLLLQVLSHMLDTKLTEHSASNVGKFVSVMFRECANQINEVLEVVLRAVLSKLQQAQTLTVAQSLIVIFANLFNHELSATLNFLCSVPGPRGNTGLAFVMDEWCEKHAMFYGSYESKLCTIALCKLLQHGVMTADDRLQNIMVKGDQIFTNTGAPRTRSKAREAPEQWTTVSLLVKIYKILLSELAGAKESNGAQDGEWLDDSEEDESFDGGDNRQSLTELLESVERTFDHGDYDETEDDPDALLDPINSIDLTAYLTNFIMEFSTTPVHTQHFTPHLTEVESDLLRSIGVNC